MSNAQIAFCCAFYVICRVIERIVVEWLAARERRQVLAVQTAAAEALMDRAAIEAREEQRKRETKLFGAPLT